MAWGCRQVEVSLLRFPKLLPGTAMFPEGGLDRGIVPLRLGSNVVEVRTAAGAPAGQIGLALDVWERLAVPYPGIRLQMRTSATGEVELGPVVAVLLPGQNNMSPTRAADRLRKYAGHLTSRPGLFMLGFDEAFDWGRGILEGHVLDNRPGQEGAVLAARCPLPAAVALTWSIRRDVITQLRQVTGERTFNWIRSIGKWQFHKLLSTDSELRSYLPDTRVLRGPADIAVMLTRYETVFVKHTHGIQGRGTARVRRLPDGLEVRHMEDKQLKEVQFPDLTDLVPYVRQVAGPGRAVVQQGIPVTGRLGRALDFRVLVVRDRAGNWCCPVATANVAPDDRVVFTNLANGATDEDLLTSLEQHHGMAPDQAKRCAGGMVELCLTAARALEGPYHPLGILGFDVAVETGSDRFWLLEANATPGWGYPPEIEVGLAHSMVDYALLLAGYPPTTDRLP